MAFGLNREELIGRLGAAAIQMRCFRFLTEWHPHTAFLFTRCIRSAKFLMR